MLTSIVVSQSVTIPLSINGSCTSPSSTLGSSIPENYVVNYSLEAFACSLSFKGCPLSEPSNFKQNLLCSCVRSKPMVSLKPLT